MAELKPNMLQEFPTWLLQQHYQPNSYTTPVPWPKVPGNLDIIWGQLQDDRN
jgi:hypothetical protein